MPNNSQYSVFLCVVWVEKPSETELDEEILFTVTEWLKGVLKDNFDGVMKAIISPLIQYQCILILLVKIWLNISDK